MNVLQKWSLWSLLVFCGATGCTRDDTSKWVKHWGWTDERYDCQIFSFGKRPACAAVVLRVGSGNGMSVSTGMDWVELGGMKVADDGKLTLHWMNGSVHRYTVLESGPLYDALRTSGAVSGGSVTKVDHALLDAFFAEHAK